MSTQLNVSVPLVQVADLKSWKGAGKLVGNQLVIAGESIHECRGDLRFEENQLSLAQLRVGWRDNNITANASGNLIAPTQIAGKLRAGPINLADVSQVLSRYSAKPLPASGTASLVGDFSADLERQKWQATGSL